MSITIRNGLPIDDATGAVATAGGGGGSPTGAAGGSLTGTYPNPTVASIPSAATATTQTARDGSTKVATTAYADAGDQTVPINTQTASYTLVAADAGRCVEENSASATVITIPPNSSVAFPVGTIVPLRRVGAGTVTITPGAGVTIPNRIEAAGTTSRTLPNQYSEASVHKRATDVWVLAGDFA